MRVSGGGQVRTGEAVGAKPVPVALDELVPVALDEPVPVALAEAVPVALEPTPAALEGDGGDGWLSVHISSALKARAYTRNSSSAPTR